ncbi:UDP-N-acetylmuramoylalanine--D-glutamate ligase [Deferribacter desulfuricans SSM1]|uniref:UDP-N-acetylmuramoylalanine--D-glutamate ligase n=1 Tax=Deferribacter desulfuricans (strain DSM 14783 / JCM 11476 / NBRC 101012 / SSM1) TaxID=639282 RepID=D3PBV3_DEFDS|nr:UDP-N-acetylmuramoyl-L-alanine--D-glutamate ligase [Deferribacter desulfuricans]BAI80076.1 UDP-N-acetylmuramoylalanine--D-glutamate ligase [Deferribacter desulfuricans SSM1]
MRAAIVGYGLSGKSAEKILREILKVDNIAIFDDKQDGFKPTADFDDENFDLVVVSPGLNIEKLNVNNKSKVISEYELVFNLVKDKTFIGITGSNGKSTTTFLTSQILNKIGLKSVACGNIGYPLGYAIFDDFDYFVVEFSSFQIDLMRKGEFLDAGVIINITPDHLDRYKTFENYLKSKVRLSELLKDDGFFVVGKDITSYIANYDLCIDTDFNDYPKLKGDVLYFENFYINVNHFPLVGKHNLVNLSFALEIVNNFYELKGDVTHLIEDLKGLPHRCEIVREIDGILFVNDSKGTNVDSTKTALKGLDGKIILLLGGLDKDGDFSELNDDIKKKCKAVVCFGRDAKNIYDQIDFEKKILVNKLKEAFDTSTELAKSGDIVLLSPGCASFDEFNNFEERGEYFKKLVDEYASK